MIAITRAGWITSAVLFGALVVSIRGTMGAGPVPFALLAGIAVLSAVRPVWGLPAVTALQPIAWFSLSWWNPQVAWAEAVACAALTGLALDACRGRDGVPRPLAAPAAVFAAIVLASLAAGLSVLSLREGPAFWQEMSRMLRGAYFTDRHLTSLHAGLLLLEGLALFAHAARLGTRPGVLQRVSAATVLGSAAAAIFTVERLVEAAARRPSFWPALVDLAGRVRWNEAFRDFNAAGSYFALALLAGVAVTAASAGARRVLWTACTMLAAAALWLTSSRIALLAAPAATMATFILPRAIRSRRQAVLAAAAGAGVCAALALVALVLPQRGIQHSPLLAADIRVGLIETGVRMMRAYPAYGIGLGEFYERSGEFSSPELLAKFPAAVHENAHNNVVQVAAETGIAGGLAFVWTIGAALGAVAWRATASRDRVLQLTFAALAAFTLTALAGHPLLVAEVAFAFWAFAGTAAGAALGDRTATPRSRRSTLLVAAALALVAITLPLRLRAAAHDTDLEHIGIGVSQWQYAADGVRYREVTGHATLFVPTATFKLSLSLRGATTTRLHISLDGRPANVLTLIPDRWIELVIPARTQETGARFRRLDLRTSDDERAVVWITKDEPVPPR